MLKDLNQAAFWYSKAAEQGNTNAQNNLGSMYEKGEGVLKDLNQAAFWYSKAAEQGDSDGQYNLGINYGTENYKMMAYWIDKSYYNKDSNAEQKKRAKDIWEKFELWKYK